MRANDYSPLLDYPIQGGIVGITSVPACYHAKRDSDISENTQ